MNATYLFKEETPNGQKKLRIGTRAEYEQIQKANKSAEKGARRYFIREKSLDKNQPDLLIIEVEKEEYTKWNRENIARCRNIAAAKKYQVDSIERIIHAAAIGKAEEPALPGEDPTFETTFDHVLISNLRNELKVWKPWAIDMLDIYMKYGTEICAAKFADRYGVAERTARRYVRCFEQKIRKFLEG